LTNSEVNDSKPPDDSESQRELLTTAATPYKARKMKRHAHQHRTVNRDAFLTFER
jgi:hypothetical protein